MKKAYKKAFKNSRPFERRWVNGQNARWELSDGKIVAKCFVTRMCNKTLAYQINKYLTWLDIYLWYSNPSCHRTILTLDPYCIAGPPSKSQDDWNYNSLNCPASFTQTYFKFTELNLVRQRLGKWLSADGLSTAYSQVSWPQEKRSVIWDWGGRQITIQELPAFVFHQHAAFQLHLPCTLTGRDLTQSNCIVLERSSKWSASFPFAKLPISSDSRGCDILDLLQAIRNDDVKWGQM